MADSLSLGDFDSGSDPEAFTLAADRKRPSKQNVATIDIRGETGIMTLTKKVGSSA
jgi:hypothetical protein